MKIIRANEFEETIKEGLVLVDFYADWCGPCKMLGPILEELSAELRDVTIAKVNVDDNGDLAAQLGVRSIPAVFLFKDGKQVDQFIGLQPKASIKNFIEKHQ